MKERVKIIIRCHKINSKKAQVTIEPEITQVEFIKNSKTRSSASPATSGAIWLYVLFEIFNIP